MELCPLLLPQQRRPRCQFEQRHFRRQGLVEDGGDDIGRQGGEVHHPANVGPIHPFAFGHLGQRARLAGFLDGLDAPLVPVDQGSVDLAELDTLQP